MYVHTSSCGSWLPWAVTVRNTYDKRPSRSCTAVPTRRRWDRTPLFVVVFVVVCCVLVVLYLMDNTQVVFVNVNVCVCVRVCVSSKTTKRSKQERECV